MYICQQYQNSKIVKSISHSIFILIVGIFLSCQPENQRPTPTGKTLVHQNGEDEGMSVWRKKWIDLMHGGEQSQWKTIEDQNQKDIYRRWLGMKANVRSENEYVADGNIYGKWSERGSSNNAGNIMAVTFDPENQDIYATGGGGPIFKGNLESVEWTLVNDKLRFSTQLLSFARLSDGTKRLISAVNGIPHYSDDGGKMWVASTGVISTTEDHIYKAQINNLDHIFILTKKDYWSDIYVYASFDHGETFQTIKYFNTSDTRNISLTVNGVNNSVYLIEQLDVDKSNIYKFDYSSKAFNKVADQAAFGFGEDGRANLQAVTYRDTTLMYAFDNKKQLYISKDEGKRWSWISPLPENPWDIGLYVCPSDPRKMFFGEVDAFRSTNGGIGWARINNWWEYYDNIYEKLHADIMTIKEFKTKSGKPFVLFGNHGGIHYSEDYGSTTANLGLFGLNVSQYYDVRTYPSNPYYIFAGSQDQGQQRGAILDDEPSELEQNISGDYGHIEFTGDGKSLWSVYPGGWIGYYSLPMVQNGPVASYEINSDNETVWIPPIMPGPDDSKNVVIAAGGSTVKASNGSYLIQLEYDGSKIIATQLPFDFSSSGGQISAMAINPHDKTKWYVATTNGQFYLSSDSGQNFIKTASMLSGSHYLYGSCILPSALSPDVIYLSGNGYQYKPVYRSTDGGKTFKSFSNGLPNTLIFNLAANEDETLIFAASEAGPYVYVAEKQKWYSLQGANTPNQTYWSVEYVPATKTARFATYGRGVWDFTVESIKTATDEDTDASNMVSLHPNPAQDFILLDTGLAPLIGSISIHNAQSSLVKTIAHLPNTPIDISTLPSGIYYISWKNGSHLISKKFIKL